jgi:lysophospholipase L1-like esterase
VDQGGEVRRILWLAGLAAVLAMPASAAATVPAEGGGSGHKVHRLKPWKDGNLYLVQRSFKPRREQSRLARKTGVQIARGTWLHIDCQIRSGGELWAIVAGGFVPDAVMKTYTDGRLSGAPTCALPHPDHVWADGPWSANKRYRVLEAQSPQHKPQLGTSLPTIVERGAWVKITCQIVGQKVRGSKLWDRIAKGGYIPDSTVKTFTDGRLPKAPRCKDAAPPAPPKFVALGDSYSSGLGGDGYFPASSPQALAFKWDYLEGEPAGRAKDCYRNRHAYSRLLAKRLVNPLAHGPSTFLACQGDTTKELLSLQIPRIPANTRLVTLTIGGNDMGFSDIVQRCATIGKSCSDAVVEHFGARGEKLATLGSTLDEVYWKISAKAPYATVIVIGYPRLFAPAKSVVHCGDLGSDDAKLLNAAGNRLNQTIQQAVGRHQAFRFVGLGSRFDGHGPCQEMGKRMWINPVALAGNRKPFSMHPNLEGQQVLAAAVAAANPGLFR